ncbi:MAG: hypothetical protein MPL62_16055 [Alphaproteobacteria bacterium]|nr:hypothetical protein [Alphaproteobacteria bacterium]
MRGDGGDGWRAYSSCLAYPSGQGLLVLSSSWRCLGRFGCGGLFLRTTEPAPPAPRRKLLTHLQSQH